MSCGDADEPVPLTIGSGLVSAFRSACRELPEVLVLAGDRPAAVGEGPLLAAGLVVDRLLVQPGVVDRLVRLRVVLALALVRAVPGRRAGLIPQGRVAG